ncbi:MAG TPA: amidohydrolase family protein [Candidatus Binataceae bacterium]|jgi:predicted TIM-barrel fold metal-dependent hydrolase|nr:amidohydrolase family protein [Candidatus Binataceae bacterium]
MADLTTAPYKLIDAFLQVPPLAGKKLVRHIDPNIDKWFKPGEQVRHGFTVDDLVRDMDAAGVERGVMTAGVMRLPPSPYSVGQGISDETYEKICVRVAEMVQQYPGRFHTCFGLDPTGMMRAVRWLVRAVNEFGFRSAWIMPSLVGLPPNHACYYPIYAKCVELGIPIKLNVGVPGPLRPASMQYPMALDEVLLAFPELIVVGCHLGHPWTNEMVALLQKHRNFYLITSAWAPKYIPAELWNLANKRGPDRLMWASDHPLVSLERCAREGWEVPLNDNARRGYLRDNVLKVFKFD